MSLTFTVRIPRGLRERMRGLDVEWSEEVRGFIEERIKRLELMKTLEEVGSRAEERAVSVDSTVLIREDRER